MEKRPILTIPLTLVDRLAEALAWALLLGMIFFTVWTFSELPDRIPSSFEMDGTVTRWGSKMGYWLLPFLGLLEWVILSWINTRPHIFSYPGKITEENAFQQYVSATRFIRFIKTAILALFLLIQYNSYTFAQTNSGLPFWVIGSFIVVFPIATIIWIIASNRKWKNQHAG